MDKRKLLIAIVAVVAVTAVIFILFDTDFINKSRQTDGVTADTSAAAVTDTTLTQNQTGGTATENAPDNTAATAEQSLSGNTDDEVLLNRETLEVRNNTPEYGLKLELCENSDNRTFIRMTYYVDGSATVNELDEGNLPELAGIFESRAKEGGSGEAFRIRQALLDPVHSQLYLLIQGAPFDAYTQASFYMVNLNDMSLKKIFSYPGLYGKMAFSKDFGMLAYSFGDPPVMSTYQEDNLLEVLDCSSGDYIIKGNRDTAGKVIGSNADPGILYDYEFEAWQSDNLLKLKQAVRPLSDPDTGITQAEVLYDIKKNLLLNLDGSELKQPQKNTAVTVQKSSDKTATGAAIDADKAAQDKPAQDKPSDSDPVKVLKSFYGYLGSENDYAKAMQLLDNGYRLRLQLLRQFGAEELVKSDIDAESASIYSNILKAARFESVIKETAKDGESAILYTHILGAGSSSQVSMTMTAKLKKSGKTWKIILMEDGIQ